MREFRVKPETLGNGSVYGLAFSHDAKQKYLLIVDGENNVVWIPLTVEMVPWSARSGIAAECRAVSSRTSDGCGFTRQRIHRRSG